MAKIFYAQRLAQETIDTIRKVAAAHECSEADVIAQWARNAEGVIASTQAAVPVVLKPRNLGSSTASATHVAETERLLSKLRTDRQPILRPSEAKKLSRPKADNNPTNP